ncbi:choice-of-anchor D domain-containing protein [Catelliglobosispora koreensis]|uniref:choice-of-anchor D domain-containing protein n=1 Tax=Catelliglobosispora koreensis TaxID=129052 RepID=UPI00035D6829|nr:choice-of-anchor D domain-containing protein [Catelliglobosispora koreensis]
MRRTLRGALVGAIAFATAVVAPATTAYAAPPSAPYNAFIIDGRAGSYLLDGTLTFDENNSTFEAVAWGTPGLDFKATMPGHYAQALLSPPKDQQFVAGTTYTIMHEPPYEGAFASIGMDHRGCGADVPGTLAVHEAVHDATSGELTAFAASFTLACGSQADAISGEMRFNSSIGFKGVGLSAGVVAFGDQPVGANGTSQVVTFTGAGSESTVMGAASLSGATPGAFTITGNTCAGASLAYGETCTVTVRANATALGEQTARLVVGDNTFAGNKNVRLSLNGIDQRLVTANPTWLSFGTQDIDRDSAVKTVTLKAAGTLSTTFGQAVFGGDNPGTFRISSDTCSGQIIPSGQTCSIGIVARPHVTGTLWAQLQVPNNSLTTPTVVGLGVEGVDGLKGRYFPLNPQRLLDTRIGLGAPGGKVGTGQTVRLEVKSRGGLPMTGIAAVVLNVTVTEADQAGHVTVFPAGVAKPTASSLNYARGWTGANSVTVGVSPDGFVDLFVSAGGIHLIADVVGFYASNNDPYYYGKGGRVFTHAPVRLFDTRNDPDGKLPGDSWLQLSINYNATINPHIRGLIVNVTATEPNGPGHLRTWNGSGDPPSTSTLNFERGKTVPNFAIIPTVPCDWYPCSGTRPMIGVYTNMDAHVIVDVVGFIDDSTLGGGMLFQPQTPERIVDTRVNQGISGKIGQSVTKTVTSPVGNAATGALALNVTGILPTVDTNMIVWEAGIAKPGVSNLNPAAGQIIPNAVITGINDANQFSVYNHGGTIDAVVDVVGWFYWLGLPGAPNVQTRGADGPGLPTYLPTPDGMHQRS